MDVLNFLLLLLGCHSHFHVYGEHVSGCSDRHTSKSSCQCQLGNLLFCTELLEESSWLWQLTMFIWHVCWWKSAGCKAEVCRHVMSSGSWIGRTTYGWASTWNGEMPHATLEVLLASRDLGYLCRSVCGLAGSEQGCCLPNE